MKTETTDTLSFPIKVTLFRQNWYAKVLEFAEQNTSKEDARKLANEAMNALWKQPMVHDPTEKQTSFVFFVWLYIACHVNPKLECN